MSCRRGHASVGERLKGSELMEVKESRPQVKWWRMRALLCVCVLPLQSPTSFKVVFLFEHKILQANLPNISYNLLAVL